MPKRENLYGGDDPGDALGLLATADHGHLTAWDGGAAQPELAFMHYAFNAEAGEITGHLANGNPLLDLLARQPRAIFTVAGASAFVPSHWLERDPDVPMGNYRVPTSYYSWAQFQVEATLVRDPGEIRADLSKLLHRHQPEGRHPGLDPDDTGWTRLMGAITGLRLAVRGARSRWKYGQNRTREQRLAIVGRLRERGRGQDEAAAQSVLARLETGVATKNAIADESGPGERP